jgi:hypothetical protein
VDAIYYKTRGSNGWTYRAQYVNPELSRTFSSAVDYLLSTLVSSMSPDVIVFYAPGVVIGDQHLGRFDQTGIGSGMHWQNQHIPLIIAGHGVSAGSSSTYPARLVDIAPSLERLMKLRSTSGDGVVLADALDQPPERAVHRQREVARQLAPVVRALQNRGKQELR